MPKPNIYLLHYAAPPTIGGVESTLAAHARLFADHGYAVTIVAGRGESFDPRVPVVLCPDLDSKSPRVLKANAELARGAATAAFTALADDLTRTLTQLFSPDACVIAHNALSLHKNLALTSALRNLLNAREIRLIAWCHDFAWTDPQYARDLHPGSPWELLRKPWERVPYVVVSGARRDESRQLWGCDHPVAVIPSGIDPFEFLGIGEPVRGWVRDLALLDAAPLLLLPARLTRRKNIEYAIEITAALHARGVSAKLVVTGPPGPHNPTNAAYLENLRARRRSLGVEESVIFLHERGVVQGAAMRDLYLLADALLFPSEREGFGIPILEAGLARLPIFCADLPPLHESAREYAHYFSPGESPASAAAAILARLEQNSAYRLKQRVLHEYSWERIFTERIEPLVHGNASEPSPAPPL